MAQKFQLVTTPREAGYGVFFHLNSSLPFDLYHSLAGRNADPFYLRLTLGFGYRQIYLKSIVYIEDCHNPTHELKLPTKHLNSDDPKINLKLLMEWLDSCRMQNDYLLP